jgi:hypothetical protein
MFFFMLKKTFFNYWDNFFHMFFINVGFFIVGSLLYGLYYLISLIIPYIDKNIIFNIIYSCFTIIAFFIYNGAVHGVVRDIADHKQTGFKDFFLHLKESIFISLGYGIFFSLITALIGFAILLYFSIPVFFNLAAQFLLSFLWFVFLIVAGQYFFPIYYGLDNRFFKIIKKMILIFLDNVLFSFGLFLLNIIILGVSFFTLFMIPGFGFVLLLHNVALKLRLYKYDYIEKNPKAKKIPWEELLIEDREKVGKRTLKGMIFPWKD